MYTIQVMTFGVIIPIIYCLMDGKSNDHYEMLFNMLEEESKQDITDREFTLMGDFEISHFNFFKKKITRKNCLFHYCQCIYRKCQKISKNDYDSHGSFYKLAKSLMILPYVSENRVKNIFNYLKNEYKNENEKELLTYFENNFINGSFKIKNWNLHDIVIRSNNQIESFHSSFNRFVRLNNPPFHQLVPKINKQIEKVKVEYDEQVKKMNRRRKKTEYLIKNKNLYTILLEENKYNDMEFVTVLMNAIKISNYKYEKDPNPTEEINIEINNENNNKENKG